MNDAVPDYHARQIDKVKTFIKECYPEFAMVADGTPTFAEAECVIVRVVHKHTKKIHQLVVRIGLFSESLDGATLAEHVTETFIGKAEDDQDNGLEMPLKNMRAASIDRASTNKRALDILMQDHGISPFAAYCMSHGISNCGKKADMDVGKDVLKHLTAMVKFKLCKARNVFRAAFGESAKKTGSVRWGTEFEMAEQVNRISLDSLRARYAKICLDEKWSAKSALKFLDATDDVHDLCMAECEIAAAVDVGSHIVPETYLCESDGPGVFTAHESIVGLRTKFAQGVDGFDRADGFVQLEEKALIAAERMSDLYMVSVVIHRYFCTWKHLLVLDSFVFCFCIETHGGKS